MEKMQNKNTSLEQKTHPELHDKFISPERATEIAEDIKNKIDFLKSIEDKINNEQDLTPEEEQIKTSLFGNKEFKKGMIGWDISGLENQHYQTATAGIDGAKYVEVSFPTYHNHQPTEFENWIKEREDRVKELYHYAGTTMDKEVERIASEYNRTAKPENKIGWWEEEKPHAVHWHSAEFVEEPQKKGLGFVFGATKYLLIKNTDGNWYVSLDRESVSLVPKDVDEKLKDLDRKITTWLKDKANEILK